MKKFTLSLLAIVFLAMAGLSQSNLPNGDMEGWHDVTVGTVTYTQIDGPMFNTLNELAAVPPPIGPGPVTVDKVSDAHTGSWAAKLHSENFTMIPNDVFIPGMLGFTQLDMLNSTIRLGKPCAGCKPVKFSGWYKFEQVNNDSCSAVFLASKWNATLHKKDTIGYCRVDFKVPMADWTYFELPVNYTGTDTPDSMLVLLVSSGGFSVTNLMGGIGQVGNTMWVDDINIEYPLGITQVLMPEVTVKTYPNPARDHMTLELSQVVKDASVSIFDLEGRLVSSQPLDGISTSFSVNALTPGQYHYKVLSGSTIQNTGFFIINR